jgi:hypothetical protein
MLGRLMVPTVLLVRLALPKIRRLQHKPTSLLLLLGVRLETLEVRLALVMTAIRVRAAVSFPVVLLQRLAGQAIRVEPAARAVQVELSLSTLLPV